MSIAANTASSIYSIMGAGTGFPTGDSATLNRLGNTLTQSAHKNSMQFKGKKQYCFFKWQTE